jgi:hypothetical protein
VGVGGGGGCTKWMLDGDMRECVWEGGRTAPCAGYWRASAMWSEESFAGRASRAVRNVLQKVSSDMLAVENRGCPILDILS